MKFKILSELTYEVYAPTTYIFNIQASNSNNQTILEESLSFSPELNFQEFTLPYSDSRYIKLQINYGTFTISYKALVEVKQQHLNEQTLLVEIPLFEMDNEVMTYISPSRHCESDKLIEFSTKEFGHLSDNLTKVKAIDSWIFNNVNYLTRSTNSSESACDTLISRQGVCKDFAHLGIALCRALDIPARYFTGYAVNLLPPDIHACFEAYIGGQWLLFDPTHLSDTNKLVKIAHGKDASEACVVTFYGSSCCTNMKIECDIAE
ncbi:MAG: transglutaminase family protein [Sphingobacteriales bacterium]|nr:transglutaminase family protein [Sphingobacteriales bacterium]